MTTQTAPEHTYFKSNIFDHFFVWGIALIGIISALLVHYEIVTFFLVFTIDIYLLGYHHVISTFTRFSYDKKSLIENRYLLFYSPVLVALSVAILFFTLGGIGIATVYLHWQWYHYTRQSEGLSKAFGIKTKNKIYSPRSLDRVLFYLTPITTFAYMSATQPDNFLFMDVYTLPIPMLLVYALGTLNLAIFLYWLTNQLIALKNKQVSATYLLYFLSHHTVYLFAYVLIKDITVGWLAINIWHNLQYISFVWYCNQKEHSRGVNKSRPIISWMSQQKNMFIYFLSCFTLSFAIYSGLEYFIGELFTGSNVVVAIVIVYTGINFHHYIVDSQIWKLRKPKLNKIVQS